MRLTLRTLLAYLDDLLEPTDAVEMGKRIEENKVATELVHRIRTRMRLLRLGAPKVDGRGIGLDPNSVAEYLDNTLPADRVLDFEKVCLESDVHLAEVASCHQVLAAVVDKPATVDPKVRLRMYNLIRLHGSASDYGAHDDDPLGVQAPTGLSGLAGHSADFPTSGLAGDDLTDVVPPPVIVSTGSEEVTPPPVVGSQVGPATGLSRVLVLAGSIALVFLLVIGGLRVLGPFDSTHPLVAWRTGGSTANGDRQVALNDVDPADASAAAGAANGGAVTTGNETGALVNGAAVVAGPVDVERAEPGEVGAAAAKGPEPVPGPNVGGGEPGRNAVNPPAEAAEVPESPDEVPAKVPPAGAVAATTGPKPNGGLPVPFGAKKPRGEAGEEPAAPEGESIELGRFLSEEHVLARRDAADGMWYRLARGTRLSDGDQLIALPVYRPQLLLATGVQVMLVGDSSVRLRAVDGTELPELQVAFGRMICASSGRPGAAVRVVLGGETGQLRFVDVDAEIAVEVRRMFSPGVDPLESVSAVQISIYARNGKVGWMGSGGREEVLERGDALVWRSGLEMAEPSQQPYPQWTSPPSVGGLDRRASEDLAGFLKVDRPITLSLGELAEFRKTEVRSLAARCLALLGQYDALWNELVSDKQYSYWDEAVDGLRESMSRSTEESTEVLHSIERLKKRNSADLFRMLRGYDATQLAEGGAAQLVDFLDHEDLEMRVLAFENLRRITESTHNYRPEKPAEARRIQTLEWRKQLKDGRIVYKTRAIVDPKRAAGEKTSRLSPYSRVR